MYHIQPIVRLTRLFQSNIQFADKVLPALSIQLFPNIRPDTRSTTQDLFLHHRLLLLIIQVSIALCDSLSKRQTLLPHLYKKNIYLCTQKTFSTTNIISIMPK